MIRTKSKVWTRLLTSDVTSFFSCFFPSDAAAHIWLSVDSKQLLPASRSLSVREVRDWFRDPVSGRWRWPENGADQVYPGIFLGDA